MPEDTIKLRIPGSKTPIKLPRWAPLAAGGAAIIALLFMRGRQTTSSGELGSDGLLAAELAQRLEEERQARQAESEDLRRQLEESTQPIAPELVPSALPGFEYTTAPAPMTIPSYQWIAGFGQVETQQVVVGEKGPLPTASQLNVIEGMRRDPTDRIQPAVTGSTPYEVAGAAYHAVLANRLQSIGLPISAGLVAQLYEVWRNIWPFFPRDFPHALPQVGEPGAIKQAAVEPFVKTETPAVVQLVKDTVEQLVKVETPAPAVAVQETPTKVAAAPRPAPAPVKVAAAPVVKTATPIAQPVKLVQETAKKAAPAKGVQQF